MEYSPPVNNKQANIKILSFWVSTLSSHCSYYKNHLLKITLAFILCLRNVLN